MRATLLLVAVALAASALAGCSSSDSGGPTSTSGTTTPAPASAFHLSSPAFADGGAIPRKYTCDQDAAKQTSPPLAIANPPAGTVTLALLVKDPDVPTPHNASRTLHHWVVWNVLPVQATFPEGGVPAGAREGDNDFGHGYLGPCPPPYSEAHRYDFTAYALDDAPQPGGNATAAQLEAAMAGHVLARATLTGTYLRQP